MPNDKGHYVGIDMAKDWFDVGLLGENAQSTLPALKKGLWNWQSGRGFSIQTSLWWKRPAATRQLLCWLCSKRVRQYARAKGRLAKTDQLDAQILAEYGKAIQPRLFVGKNEERKRLSALVAQPTE